MKTKHLLHSIYTLLISACALSMTGCGDKDEPTPPTPPEPAGPAERTVLVYMAANNNLGSSRYDRMDIDEMRQAAKAGDTRGGRLVIYHAGYNTAPTLVEILADRLDTLKVYDNENLSVSSARMAEVFSDLDEKVPARQYGLVLWSHGTGWLQDGMEEPERRRSFGLEGRHTMNVSTLAQTIEEAPFKLDFVYFDCCYMMSVETLYQMRRTAPVIAGSTTELLTTGMPYDQNIACFFKNGQADLIGAAQNTFNLYNAMSGQNRTCTMSVLSTDGLDKLADAVREIYIKATPGMPEGYTPRYFQTQACRAATTSTSTTTSKPYARISTEPTSSGRNLRQHSTPPCSTARQRQSSGTWCRSTDATACRHTFSPPTALHRLKTTIPSTGIPT